MGSVSHCDFLGLSKKERESPLKADSKTVWETWQLWSGAAVSHVSDD